MREIIEMALMLLRELLMGLVGLVRTLAGCFAALVAEGRGWSFLPVYLTSAVALLLAARWPIGDTSLIKASPKGEEKLVGYVLPLAVPLLTYCIGWLAS